MSKYSVGITETLQKYVEVEADSLAEAESIVEEEWNDTKHILDAEHFVRADFNAVEIERESINVLLVRPGQPAVEGMLGGDLKSEQAFVGGLIEPVYPFEEPVCIICNEEGKLMGLEPNRALKDEDGKVVDIVCGNFFICGCGEDNFCSLSPEQMEKYKQMFLEPECFFRQPDGEIISKKMTVSREPDARTIDNDAR